MLGSIVDHAIAPHVHKGLPFDQQRDFIAGVDAGFGTVALYVNADLPAHSVADMVAVAKAKPGKLSHGSTGAGGLRHLNAEMFRQLRGIDLAHVPCKGTSQLLPELNSGRIPLAIDSIPADLPQVKAGNPARWRRAADEPARVQQHHAACGFALPVPVLRLHRAR